MAEIADGELFGNRDIAFVRHFLTDHHAEEGGFAGAVGAAGVQLKGSVNENQLLAVLLVDAGERNHRNFKLAEASELRSDAQGGALCHKLCNILGA